MISNWETVQLGDLFQLCNSRLGEHEDEPPVFAISKHDGVVLSSDYHDRRVASAKLDTYKVVNADAWAYSTIHIDEGSIARNRSGFSGVVSPMYTIMEWISKDHDPSFFELLLRSPKMLIVYGDFAQGSINRRKSLPWKTFAALEVAVPPLADQKRIVDLVGSLDKSIEAAEGRSDFLQILYRELLADTATVDAPKFPLSRALNEIKERATVVPEAEYRIAGIARSGMGFIDRGNVLGSAISYSKLTRVGAGQLVYRKLTAWEGPIAVADAEIDGSFVSPEFPVFEVNNNVYSHRLLGHLCRWSGFWDMMAGRLTGSVLRRKRLSPSQLLEIELPVPALSLQYEIADRLDATWEALLASSSYANSVRTLRSEMLTSLLSGAHTIPESYETLLDAVNA